MTKPNLHPMDRPHSFEPSHSQMNMHSHNVDIIEEADELDINDQYYEQFEVVSIVQRLFLIFKKNCLKMKKKIIFI